mmetsp:Transcript_11745/g.16856  ORF Transcript_11745/g.16856 Transcript_11745/m.16856 type:complete len:168 (-) Transcript_11745:292-795(-)
MIHGNRNSFKVVYATFKALTTHKSLEDIAFKRVKKRLNLQRAIILGSSGVHISEQYIKSKIIRNYPTRRTTTLRHDTYKQTQTDYSHFSFIHSLSSVRIAFIAADALSLLEIRRLLTGEETTFVFADASASPMLSFVVNFECDLFFGETVILALKRPQRPSMSLAVG